MEKTEPTFVPEWLKSRGGLNTASHQFTSSSLNSGEQGVSKSARNKSLDKDLGRPSISDRTTSSYFRRASISNGSANLRSYSSFNRNNRDNRDSRDWDKNIYEFRNNREKLETRHHRDYSDPLANILPSRFEKDRLRRSHSSLSGKRGESWPKKVASDLSIANKSSNSNGSALLSVAKTSFERDFPSLGADEKQSDNDIGRVPSPGLSSAIQSLPIGSSAVIGGDGWTSALAEVPVIVGKNGNGTSSVQSNLISATASTAGGRNMAETLVHGPPKTQTAPQLNVGTQRLEELAAKQSRQLIPMTPSMPKALALNTSDKPKFKPAQSQLQSSHLINNPHTPRFVNAKPDVSNTSTVGKLLVLKPSRERNGTTKESLSPTGGSKLPNNPVAVPVVAASAPLSKPAVVSLEKRPSSQAQSRSNFFNLMRKKSLATNSSALPCEKAEEFGASEVVEKSSETKVDLTNNGDSLASVTSSTNNGKNHSGIDAFLYSEEEEARFLRSLGWDETGEEEEEGGLTEEEISSFYQSYMNLKPASKILPKLLIPMGGISSDSNVDA